MKKITRATLKSFVGKNLDNLFIKVKSDFDPMIDCVSETKNNIFVPITKTNGSIKYTLGIQGCWLVGQSRDYFKEYEDENFIGIDIDNSCGSFLLVIKK